MLTNYLSLLLLFLSLSATTPLTSLSPSQLPRRCRLTLLCGTSEPKKVVIIGGGFAGLYTCKALSEKGPYDVTMISPSPRFTFSPLLYELATGDREIDDVSPTLNSVLPTGTAHLEASAESVSFPTRTVACRDASGSLKTVSYDYLVIGSGLRSGLSNPTPDCSNFSTVEDALNLRRRISYLQTLPAAVRVAVVGGGYSGVEVALCVKKTMPTAEVTILQRSGAVLPAAKGSNRELAVEALIGAGVEVVGGVEVESVEGGGVTRADGGVVKADQIIWTAATDAKIGVDLGSVAGPDDRGVQTDECLRVVDKVKGKAYRNVFALGDVAAVEGRESRPNAQVAMAQAGCVALNIGADERGERPVAFGMVELGEMLTLGETGAVAGPGGIKIGGRLGRAVRSAVYDVRKP